MTRPARLTGLVVLGGDETGLAVVRNAAAHRVRPLVIARPGDVATHSRLARCVVVEDPGTEMLGVLQRLGSPARPPLIATNDRWLRFIVTHREALEACFTVLHPASHVLEICLNKRRFADWCQAHDIPTPAVVTLSADTAGDSTAEGTFPLIVRPEWSNQRLRQPVPKASLIANAEQMGTALRAFEAAGCPWLATRSLLETAREQYSVAVARRGEAWLSFVARKLRPLPDRCAVGSYVVLRPHEAAESLARTALRRLGFDHGVAEVEIIGVATGELFVIEVNPRPWSQFALSFRSGHDMLDFLVEPSPRSTRRHPEGVAWIAFGNDFFTCFSRSSGVVRAGRVRLTDYLRSLAHVRVFSRFALQDPYPALHRLLRSAGTAARALRSRHRVGRAVTRADA